MLSAVHEANGEGAFETGSRGPAVKVFARARAKLTAISAGGAMSVTSRCMVCSFNVGPDAMERAARTEAGPGTRTGTGSPRGEPAGVGARSGARLCTLDHAPGDGVHRPVRTLARIVGSPIVGSPPDLRSWTVVRYQRSFLHR